ncbi:transposase-like protein [Bradyrhizobium sp. GM24.11]
MATKKELLAQEVTRAVAAGKPAALQTVDFNDPNRPKTCLEVDFPILPVNQVAIIEGNAGKPIYQMSKWWARRRSSVFRSMLIGAAAKAPEDSSLAGKLVWENYYANHQKKGSFDHLKVADIFMGGGTTLVEGSRLGMKVFGNDLNSVAWFVVKQEFATVRVEDIKQLLSEIEAEVKPQVMPFYSCEGPGGEKGEWTHKPTGRVMGPDFDPLSIEPKNRREFSYSGPEIVYSFWAKHGPCQVTGCGHRTPLMTSAVIATKSISVKHWKHHCSDCGADFDVEAAHARIAPDAPQFIAPSERRFAVVTPKSTVVCPICSHSDIVKLGKGANKKVKLSLLVHPEWLAGSPKCGADGKELGGAVQDSVASTVEWNRERAKKLKLLEVRGSLPDEVKCPATGATFVTGKAGGTIPKSAKFACGSCGTIQSVVSSVAATKKTAPSSVYAIQGYSKKLEDGGNPYRGRFFRAETDTRSVDAAAAEWERRKETDLKDYWPRSEIPFGHMTHQRQPLPQHGYTRWVEMFNPRQLLVLTQLLKAILTVGEHSWEVREYVLGAFQQYLRNQNMLCFWDREYDKLVPSLSNNNFHPKALPVENCVFTQLGRGNWLSCSETILEGRAWGR